MKNLPVEILSKILFNLPVNLSDRLVCRAFNEILTPRSFRRIRTSEFTKDAFDRLVNLSQSGLSRYVQDYEYLVYPPSHIPGVHEVDGLIALENSYGGVGVDEMAADLVRRHEVYLHQVDILGTFYDVLSLSKALPGFRNLKSVTVSRFDRVGDASRTLEDTTARAWWAVIKALNKCEYPVERLHVDAVYHGMLHGVPMAKMLQVYEVLGDLKELSITAISLGNEVFHRPVHAALRSFLRAAKNLEVVRLGNHNRLRMDLVNKDLGHLWPNLRVLDLSANTAVDPGDLVSFLELHRHTLRELTLRRFGLLGRVENGTHWVWARIFEVLRNTLTLTKLTLSDLHAPVGLPAVTTHQLREWERMVPRSPEEEMSLDRY